MGIYCVFLGLNTFILYISTMEHNPDSLMHFGSTVPVGATLRGCPCKTKFAMLHRQIHHISHFGSTVPVGATLRGCPCKTKFAMLQNQIRNVAPPNPPYFATNGKKGQPRRAAPTAGK